MSDYLVKHAIKNIWCTPDQDNQVILKPVRITPGYGVWNSWKVMWTTLKLPVLNKRFHLYHIGQVHPLLINLFPKVEEWTTLADACTLNKVVADLYLTNGLQLPRIETWYIVTEERNIILAVKENANFAFNPRKDDIYIRLYGNEYFNSQRATYIDNHVYVDGMTVNSTSDILKLQTEFEKRNILPGGTYAFNNGYKIRNISLATVAIGNTVEFIYDSSITKIVDFKVSNLNTFDSVLDNVGKYLLHYNGGLGDNIDYRDDIDLFIIDGTTQKGIYYHKNTDSSLRMLSHRDYSVPVNHISSYLDAHPNDLNRTNIYLRLHIRNSGYYRPLINEHNRIKELYKLNDEAISKALLGLDSTVNNWRAEVLENSAYAKIMGEDYLGITQDLTTQAYGYNAITKLVADTPLKTFQFFGQTVAKLPFIFQNNSTAFEYDANGLFLSHHYSPTGAIYNCTNVNCAYVEMILGNFGKTIDDRYNVITAILDPKLDYRFYVKQNEFESGTPIWQDVTGSALYHIDNDNIFTWLNGNTHDTLIRSNKYFLVNTHSFDLSGGLFEFNLEQEYYLDGVTLNRIMAVPMGELDIFLNGNHLIEGLDYYVNFPEVVIVNKEYLIDPLNVLQEVTVRFTGLCDNELNKTPSAEFGYIRNGIISNNQKYNIRDDKVISIYVDGKLYPKDKVIFNEESNNFTLMNAINGKPYLIKDTVVPTISLTKRDTYVHRQESLDVDKSISDYFTLKIPEVGSTLLNPIDSYHDLYSPFIAKIMFDLKNGVINSPVLKQQYNDDQVRELVSSYEHILLTDPITLINTVNKEYVKIHPHHLPTVVELDIYQYTFLNRVVILYCSGLVDLSPNIMMI